MVRDAAQVQKVKGGWRSIGSERGEKSEISEQGYDLGDYKRGGGKRASVVHEASDVRARICLSFRCNRIKKRTHVRQRRMVALLHESQWKRCNK